MVAIIELAGGAALATALLVWISYKWDELNEQRDEIERDIGWHRMWHERIWEPEDEDRGNGRDQ